MSITSARPGPRPRPSLDTTVDNPFLDTSNPFLAIAFSSTSTPDLPAQSGVSSGSSGRNASRLGTSMSGSLAPRVGVQEDIKPDISQHQQLPYQPSPRRLRSRKKTTGDTTHEAASASRIIKVKREGVVKTEPGLFLDAEEDSAPVVKKRKYTRRKKVEVNDDEVKVKREQGVEVKQEATSGIGGQQVVIARGKGKEKAKTEEEELVMSKQNLTSSQLEAGPSKAKIVQEKRAKKFRDKAPKAIMDRASRVKSQRMFMLDRQKLTDLAEQFQVLGSTGNVYTVVIDSQPFCSCPDFQKGNSPCKHVIFIFLKVLKVPETSLLWFQKALLMDELHDVFVNAPPIAQGSVGVPEKVRNAYLRATGAEDVPEEVVEEIIKSADHAPGTKRLDSLGEDCPVCYEEMTAVDDQRNRLIWDEAMIGCGKALHRECFNNWASTLRAKGENVTCVWCRTPWSAGRPSGRAGGSGGVTYTSSGYMNLAGLAGISRKRDTSSYYHGPVAGRTMASLAGRYEDD